MVRIVDVAINETEVQCRREKNDEAKDHFLAVHVISPDWAEKSNTGVPKTSIEPMQTAARIRGKP
jgi:hypothetical protein